MTVDAARSVDDIRPIAFDTDARTIGLGVYDRLLTLLEELEPRDWEAPTDCPAWTVADMVGHLIGAARGNASLREAVRQQLSGMRHKDEFSGNSLDAVNALQVRDHAGLSPEQRIAELRAICPRAVAGRMRFPRLLRSVRVPLDHSGSTADGMPRSLSLGHLVDVIYTRDVWLHRVDIARATGRALNLDPAVDGRVVEDVVAEWARRHGQPFRLVLSGPAGGTFQRGHDGPQLAEDAVEFCRILSGRADGDGLLTTRVLF